MNRALLLFSFVACGGPAEPREVGTTPPVPPPEPTPPAAGAWVPHGEAALPLTGSTSRDRRRMDVDQLDASIRAVTNGIGWDVNGENQFVKLSATLGKPDYLQNTFEDLGPNLLFQKFLEDAAASACDRLMTRERAGGADNVFLVEAGPDDTSQADREAIAANLSYLLLRYHGRQVAPDAPALEPWLFLFDGAELAANGDPIVAWRTVCTALLTHPDFYSY